MYSRHKKDHFMNFQSIVSPEGLLLHFYGPIEGRRHDMKVYHESGMDGILSEDLLINGVQYRIYRDKAEVVLLWMQVGYTGELTVDQVENKAAMNALRIVMQWV